MKLCGTCDAEAGEELVNCRARYLQLRSLCKSAATEWGVVWLDSPEGYFSRVAHPAGGHQVLKLHQVCWLDCRASFSGEKGDNRHPHSNV